MAYGYEELERALEESVKLQSHYAELLNNYDSGERLIFKDAYEWLRRLRTIDNKAQKQWERNAKQ